MNRYLQYHNVANEGLLLSDPPFSASRLAIHTRRPNVREADGRVFLIAGIGRPRRYFLWQTFEIEQVTSNGDSQFEATGTGWELAPPVELNGKPFDDFKAACANFVGFRSINDHPFTRTLTKLAEENRPPGDARNIVSFLNTLDGLLPDDDPERAAVRTALGHYQPARALSIRQPHAEAIMRGVKKIEYRSAPTKIRGRVFIYASLGRYSAKAEAEMMADYGIRDVTCDQLRRGVLIGSVELFECDGGDWHVRKPERAEKLVQPTKQPQPVWFYPF
ncbi:MAG: ASCH domain-containing protein [Planctomycetes bacterium]|nr:ASCH domain-containing protein [Planctomycetota bacterium]